MVPPSDHWQLRENVLFVHMSCDSVLSSCRLVTTFALLSLKSQQFAHFYKITIFQIQTHTSFHFFHVRSPTKTHLRYFHATTCSPQRPTAITTDICDRFMSQCAQENQVSQRTFAEFQVSQRTFAMFWSNVASLKSHNGHLRVSSLTTYICGVFSFPTSQRLQLPDATFSNISALATSRCTGAGWCFQFGANISWGCVFMDALRRRGGRVMHEEFRCDLHTQSCVFVSV